MNSAASFGTKNLPAASETWSRYSELWTSNFRIKTLFNLKNIHKHNKSHAEATQDSYNDDLQHTRLKQSAEASDALLAAFVVRKTAAASWQGLPWAASGWEETENIYLSSDLYKTGEVSNGTVSSSTISCADDMLLLSTIVIYRRKQGTEVELREAKHTQTFQTPSCCNGCGTFPFEYCRHATNGNIWYISPRLYSGQNIHTLLWKCELYPLRC